MAVSILAAGCSGVISESKDSNGKVERLRLDGGENWSSYDNKPRLPYVGTGRHGFDDMSLMLLKESTF